MSTDTTHDRLDLAVAAIRELPASEQEQFATELMMELSLRNQSALSPEQQEVLDERLRKPFTFASPDAVTAVYSKY